MWAVEVKALSRGQVAARQRAGLEEIPLDEGGLADHTWTQDLGQRSAYLRRGEGFGELPGFAQLPHIGMAVHGQGIERHDPVADSTGAGLERPGPLPVRQRLVKLADERAVQHVHQRPLHGQVRLPAWIDSVLPGERDSLRTPFERPPPEQLRRQRQQELGYVREQLRPDLVDVERAADGRVGQYVAHDALAEQAERRDLLAGGQQVPRGCASLTRLYQVPRDRFVQPPFLG